MDPKSDRVLHRVQATTWKARARLVKEYSDRATWPRGRRGGEWKERFALSPGSGFSSAEPHDPGGLTEYVRLHMCCTMRGDH